MDLNSTTTSPTSQIDLDDSYRPLPSVYLAFLAIWAVSGFSWGLSSWRNRHFQANNLQWMLSLVPLIKTLQLALAFSFWYSCINLEVCSLWMSFGVYVTGILFQTAAFVAFLLISHGYCIVCERISLRERRTTAGIGCLLYLTQIGYKAGVPYFTAFLLASYMVSFYIIFRRISENLSMLSEQLNFIEDEDVQSMHGALNTKYIMFKRFQGTMQIVAVAYILMNINTEDTPDNYWFRLLVREWVQYCIFLYIGWNFRIPDALMHFSVMPALKSGWEMTVPPVYSVEVDEAEFKDLISQEWHVGVRTSSCSSSGKATDPVLVIVQNPRATHKAAPTHYSHHNQVVGITSSTSGRYHTVEDQV
ncbi:Lung seven transmembrane receptor [Carex littledalei]|uniref:Lung seven transmembrane receptor n=1 Tax=Carex littledalei TaxID=544730 RepID=A0A833RGL5_9POAL|nr:Lung seven transmembrane receptor [Carex littledalei]